MRISDWSSDVCSSDLVVAPAIAVIDAKARLHVGNQFVFGHEDLDFRGDHRRASHAAARKDFCSDDSITFQQLNADIVQPHRRSVLLRRDYGDLELARQIAEFRMEDRKSTRLNSSH